MEKKWNGNIVHCVFRTQEGFEKEMDMPEFRHEFTIPVRNPIKVVYDAPDMIEDMDTGLNEKRFYFEEWIDKENKKALFVAK